MDVFEAVDSRIACRAFLDKPLDLGIVRELIVRAQRAASGGNLQSWNIYALANQPLADFKRVVADRITREDPRHAKSEYPIYPEPMFGIFKERREAHGAQLYGSLGIAPTDTAGRLSQYKKNFEFFNAPVALFMPSRRFSGPRARYAEKQRKFETRDLRARISMPKVAFVVGDYPPAERKRREDTALSFATSDTEVGIVSVPATPYFHGLTPAEIQLVAPAFIQAFRDAEKQGYDAVVPLGTLDLGVDGGRSAVDIPIIGPTEAMLHVANLVGDRFGGIVYHDKLLAMMQAIVRRYGMEHKMVGWQVSGFDLPDIAENTDGMKNNFIARARELIERDGCDVILALGITQCPVHMKPQWLQEQLGVPVVEGIGAPIPQFAGVKVE